MICMPTFSSGLRATLARAAETLTGDALEDVVSFLHAEMNPDGGFEDRSGASDLYYTVFGLESLEALGDTELSADTVGYLEAFGDGKALDFVHLCCLARCWRRLPVARDPDATRALAERLEEYRTADGGYGVEASAPNGTAYGAFLAMQAYEDLDLNLPGRAGLARCVEGLRTGSGAYSNVRGGPAGMVTTTASAALVLGRLDRPLDEGVGKWLMSCCDPDGGFRAAPQAPQPDLLSTATALYALKVLDVPLKAIADDCFEYVESLWDHTGGFRGHIHDPVPDSEYTYYALLALGCLADYEAGGAGGE